MMSSASSQDGAPEAALAACLLEIARVSRVMQRSIAQAATGSGCVLRDLAPQVDQHTADVRVLDPDWAVEVPRETDPALAAARLVGRQAVFQARIVGRLQLPGNDAVLDKDFPRAGPGAVHAVRRAHPLVVLETIPVELFPLALGG